MNPEIPVYIFVETIMYLVLYNLHDSTFKFECIFNLPSISLGSLRPKDKTKFGSSI